jgi:hypothetical protein
MEAADKPRRSRVRPAVSALLGLLIWAVYAAVCLHSVEEIHYLKSFFPERFTVEEAYYASLVELIKVVIIGVPLLPALAACLALAAGEGKGR